MLISTERNETRVAVLESKQVVQLYSDRKWDKSIVGNIYYGKVENVLSSLDAAFVNIGEDRNAFLYINEVAYDPDLEEKREIVKKIQNMLKPNQKLLVQVTKDPMKNKGARLTTFVSLPGRYLVLAPFNDGIGVSRKIEPKKRELLRQIGEEIKPKDCGLIIRTAAEKTNKAKLKKDLKVLLKQWSLIQKKQSKTGEPGIIHQECSIIFKLLRDSFSDDFEAIYVDSKATKKEIGKFFRSIGVSFNNIIVHQGQFSLFEKFNVNEVIEGALERKVWLKSGGFIVFDYGEALTMIDVNTGKFTSSRSSAHTILRTNLEAAEAICAQLRLRDIGGIIVIDFIDMLSPEDRSKVLTKFKQCLEKDSTKTEVLNFSKFGLLEMTRKNVSDGILGTMCKICPTCEGMGYIKSEETVRLEVERKIRKLAKEREAKAFLIKLNTKVAALVIGKGGKNLKNLERITKKLIAIKSDDTLPLDSFLVEAEGEPEQIIKEAKPFRIGEIVELTVEENYSHNNKDALSRLNGYVIQIIDGRKYMGEKVKAEIKSVTKTSAVASIK